MGSGRPQAHRATYPLDPELPAPIGAALSDLAAACAGGALEAALQEAWLKRLTGYGFARVPPPLAARRLADDEVVAGSPDDPVAWAPRGGSRLVCAAQGHAFALPASPAAVALLERLNTGEPRRVGELLAECAALGERPHVLRGVVNELVRLRAVTTREEAPWATRSVRTRRRTPGDSAR